VDGMKICLVFLDIKNKKLLIGEYQQLFLSSVFLMKYFVGEYSRLDNNSKEEQTV
jgi:hypothetical protein